MLRICAEACSCNADSASFPEHWLFHHRWQNLTKGSVGSPLGQIHFDTVGGRTTAFLPTVQRKGERDGPPPPKPKKEPAAKTKGKGKVPAAGAEVGQAPTPVQKGTGRAVAAGSASSNAADARGKHKKAPAPPAPVQEGTGRAVASDSASSSAADAKGKRKKAPAPADAGVALVPVGGARTRRKVR